MQYLEISLENIYNKILHKESFLPLMVANALVVYKLTHNSEAYWESFAQAIESRSIKNTNDIYLFFIDFLPHTDEFKKSYEHKIEHLKEFRSLIEELFFKQKYFYKNPDEFSKLLSRYITGIYTSPIKKITLEIFELSANIRFK